MLVLATAFIGLLIIWLITKSIKPKDFPPGPPKYPIIGNALEISQSGQNTPSIFYGVRKFAKLYGKVFGFHLGSEVFVVLTDYQDIKDMMKKEELSARSPFPPQNRFRPGWETVEKFEPELNKDCTPGVIGSNVSKYQI